MIDSAVQRLPRLGLSQHGLLPRCHYLELEILHDIQRDQGEMHIVHHFLEILQDIQRDQGEMQIVHHFLEILKDIQRDHGEMQIVNHFLVKLKSSKVISYDGTLK